jgi:parallel beta-helix repeat protein
MIRTTFGLLVVAAASFMPVAAQEQSVACGAVLDRPGAYHLSGNLDCPLIPPGPFCDTPVITITAPDVRLDGRGFTLSGIAGIGIRITATGADVRDIAIEGFRIGVHIAGGGANRLTRVSTESISLACDDRGTGLELSDTTGNVVTNSEFSRSIDWGVRLVRAHWNRIASNQIVDNRFRPGDPAANVALVLSDNNQIAGNDLSRGGLWGVRLEGSNGNFIGGNVVDETAGNIPFGIGIVLADSSRNIVAANRLNRVPVAFTTHTGLFLFGSSTGNLVVSNQVLNHTASGIRAGPGATGNLIYFNEATGNTPWDGEDQNPGCEGNSWGANTFQTANQPCVDAWPRRWNR